MIHTLYKTTNIKNGKYYIGVHTTDDVGFGTDAWVDPYVGSGKGISRALKKYGRGAFSVEIIAYFDNADHAYDAEKDLVTEDWLVKNKKQSYNMTPGGFRPPRPTPESAAKSHQARLLNGHYERYNFNSPEMRAKTIRASLGNKWGANISEEMREKKRQLMKEHNPMENPKFRNKISTKLKGNRNGNLNVRNKVNNPMKDPAVVERWRLSRIRKGEKRAQTI